MKLYCHNCIGVIPIYIEMAGPHLKAMCSECNKYIKFLNPEEKKELEREEDEKHGNARRNNVSIYMG